VELPMPSRKHVLASRIRQILGWGVGVFFAIQFVGGVVIDYCLPWIRFPSLFDRMDQLCLEPKTPDLVYFGSSRSMSSLDDSELTHELRRCTGRDDFRAFGAAQPGCDFVAMEGCLHEMLRRGVRPSVVILEIVPQTLMTNNRWYNLHVFRQLRWNDLPEHAVDICRDGQIGRAFLSRCVPLFVYRLYLLEALTGGWPTAVPDEIAPRDPTTEDAMIHRLLPGRHISDRQVARASLGAADIGRDMHGYSIGGGSARALERILAECRRQRIATILVGIPVSSAHRAQITPEVAEPYYAHIRRLCDGYGAVFLDCHDALPDSLFKDHHHTRYPAGVMFSRLLARRLTDSRILPPTYVVPADLFVERDR
jgi:hypothetical protein